MVTSATTIAAISTPFGKGGIAVIRISGSEAFCVADKFFVCQRAKRLFELAANTAVYGKVFDKEKKLIDSAVATVFKAPHSYTGEDTVEISCHGGVLVAKKVLKAAISAGAVLAERGEFSKRAFLNGKMDLTQAEGVIELINSVSEGGAEAAVFQMEGLLSKSINSLREKLLGLISHMEAAVDFPEEDIEELSEENVTSVLKEALADTERLIKTADYGRILRDGMPVAVIGKPNVGKSSLLNMLSGCEKAIVTDVAGTTRDIVEEYVNVAGVAIKLMDTAGIHETEDKVETIGVEKSIAAARQAALVLAVLDNSTPPDGEDRQILDMVKDKNHIVVLNKTDLGSVCGVRGIPVCAKSGEGIDALMEEIGKRAEEAADGAGDEIITNERHYQCLLRSRESIENALSAAYAGVTSDMLAIDVQLAIEAFGEIVGQTVSEEIVDRIFHDFCLGK